MRSDYEAAWIAYLRQVVEDLESGKIRLLKASFDYGVCDRIVDGHSEIARDGDHFLNLKIYDPEMDRR